MKIKVEDNKLLFGDEEYYIHPEGFLSSTNPELSINLAIERMLKNINFPIWDLEGDPDETESDETES